MFQEQQQQAKEMAKYMLALEEDVHTHNHYYTQTVQKLREMLVQGSVSGAEAKDEFASFLSVASVKEIRAMSIDDSRTLDLQIEIFAYWKVELVAVNARQ
jgi:hypothetical protein